MVTAYLLTYLLREAHLLQASLAVPVGRVIGVALVIAGAKRRRQGEALEQRREREGAGQALVRYVQLHRQCSEDVAYQRLAAFVKTRVGLDDHGFMDRRLASERQSLLEIARDLLADDPDAIDAI